jgi:hypothetical protein
MFEYEKVLSKYTFFWPMVKVFKNKELKGYLL